ncbi:hypothetical protein OAT18_01520 [Tenacibaculum sp.]|nr:hypothetical protein [Tenacibaculum sp.]
MEKNYQKEYIDISTEFRKSNSSKESLDKLFDLLYELEKVNRSKNEVKILSDIYTLLGFHLSAYEVYKPTVDLTNRKETKKLYTLEQKAKSNANNFTTKDIRKLREKKEQIKFLFEDFEIDKNEEDKNRFLLKNKDIVIFNKPLKHDKFEIYIYGEHKFKDYIARIIEYIYWLGSCKNVLIEFYNSEISEHICETANEDWYDTLDIFSTRIIIGQNGKLFSEISGGDEFMADHILDIETEEKKITEMSYDG